MTPDRTPRHLFSVWNPSYADGDVMDHHLEVLLHWAAERKEGRAEEEDIYVWWAKIRSPNRQEPLPHVEDVLAIQAQIEEGVETHLYLTDYISLYVAHIVEITAVDVPGETPGERGHMPSLYDGQMADFWFHLWDIRRLVAKDQAATIEECRKLKNTHYHNKPVSFFGGIVDLPLIVTRDDDVSWFADVADLTEGRRWAQIDARFRGETERLSADLRQNLFGRRIWDALEPSTHAFLTSGEATFRSQCEDPGFDFSGPAVAYSKAVETEINSLIFPPLKRALASRPVADRMIEIKDRKVDLCGAVPHQTLGSLKHLLSSETVVRDGLKAELPKHSEWLLESLPHLLAPLIALRNAAAHKSVVTRKEVGHTRRTVLGIGCEGLIVKIGEAKLAAKREKPAILKKPR